MSVALGCGRGGAAATGGGGAGIGAGVGRTGAGVGIRAEVSAATVESGLPSDSIPARCCDDTAAGDAAAAAGCGASPPARRAMASFTLSMSACVSKGFTTKPSDAAPFASS